MGLFAELYYEYSTGRNLTIFDKDHDTVEGSRLRIALSSPGLGGSYSQAYGFATITMYSWWQSSEIKWRKKICSSPGGGVEAGHKHSCTTIALTYSTSELPTQASY